MAELIVDYESELFNIPRMEKNLINKVIAFSGTIGKQRLIEELVQQSEDAFDHIFIFASRNVYPNIDNRLYHVMDIKTILGRLSRDREDKLFIIDDSVFTDNANSSIWDHIKEAIINNKYYRLTIFLSLQSPLPIPADIWKNIKYTFYTPERFIRNSRQILAMYSTPHDDADEELFLEIMDCIGKARNHYLCIKNQVSGTPNTIRDLLNNGAIYYYSILN